MNKTYIKRQLTLHKLGFPMNKDIQEYLDYFNKIIGDPTHYKKECGKYLKYKGYIYSKNDIELLFYEKENEIFDMGYHNIWYKFEEKFELNYEEVSDLLSCLLEEIFKCKVSKIYASMD